MIYFQNMNRTMENYVHYLGKNTEACVKDELLIDKELFIYYLGESFDNDCTNIEETDGENENKKRWGNFFGHAIWKTNQGIKLV